MNKLEFSFEARQDLFEIVAYLKQFNPKVAKETYQNIKKTIYILKQFKEAGVERPDLTDEPLRFLFFEKYVIGYNPHKNPIEIVRVLSSEMDLFDKNHF